jgi:glycosyltransferase involved in cell wall biosynthesis
VPCLLSATRVKDEEINGQTLVKAEMNITFVMRPDANLVRGGAEVQVDRTREELEKLGIAVQVLTPLTRDVGDLVHFFGTWESHWLAASTLVKREIPYVCSPIYASKLSPSEERRRAFRKRLLGNSPKYLSRLFSRADRLFYLTSLERDRVCAAFGASPSRFSMVPNGVDPRFATGNADAFRQTFGIEGDFVLQTASIYPDKNQLRLIQALEPTGIPIIFIGPVFDPDYAKACKAAAGSKVQFIDPLPESSELLFGAYAAARVFCLPSKFEVLSLAALEAATAGCALVLSNTWGAEEHFGKHARLVDYRSPTMIRQAVEAAWASPPEREPQQKTFLERFSWPTIAATLASHYEQVLSVRSRT